MYARSIRQWYIEYRNQVYNVVPAEEKQHPVLV
jgi:hypothetical protein